MNYINSFCILWFMTTANDHNEPFTLCSELKLMDVCVCILSDLLLNFASILTVTTRVSLALNWEI